MSLTSDILSRVDLDQIASAVGSDPNTVRSAASQAIGALVGGMEQNTQSNDGALSLANALGQHVGSPAAADSVDLNTVDLNDGAAIANHILPASQQAQLFGGAQGALIQKLLPLLAPIVMAYMAQQLTKNGGLGGVLGQVLGGAGQQQQTQSGGLGDVLGQILGGSQSGASNTTAPASVPQGGGLGDVLGQILGGGQSGATANVPGQISDPGLPTQQQTGSAPSVGGILSQILFGK